MTPREKVLQTFTHANVRHGVMWTGHPNDNTVPIYAKEWGIEESREAIFNYLSDDCRWIKADLGYHSPDGRILFDPEYAGVKKSLSAPGCFAEAEELSDLDDYPWPDAKYLDFTNVYKEIDTHQNQMVFTGMWSPFFHIMCDFFGMAEYFVKMYENPMIVEALTERVVDFYVDANEKFFAGLGDRADVMFFGNDFGTQRGLLISPDMFRKFILPPFKRLIAVGKKYNKLIMLHSCGSITEIIPDLIDSGVDILHPIQAQASGMSAKELAQYKNDLAFVGGIDAQSFFVNASPQEIKTEVRRVRDLLGPSLVVSPSHEEILPNIPAANVRAMAEEAHSI